MSGPHAGDPLMGRELQIAELDLTIGTTWTTLIPAPGAGKRIRLHSLVHFNKLATGRFRTEVRKGQIGNAHYRHSTSNQQRVWKTLPGDGLYIRCAVNGQVQARVSSGDPADGDVIVTALYDIEG